MSKIAKALEKAALEQSSGAILQPPHFIRQQESVPETRQPITYTQSRIDGNTRRNLEAFRIISSLDDPAIHDRYNLLRTQIMSRTKIHGHNTIMITSATPGEGKTTTAINLALSIAKHSEQTALLVDMDLRSPDISTYLALEGHAGITDYLLKDIQLDTLLIHPQGMQDIVVLPAGQCSEESTELLGTPKMQSLVRELKTRYKDRYVIFDCPSLVDNPDAIIFSSYVDGIVMVVESDKTPKDKVQKAMELLKEKNLVGLVMNKTPYAH